MYMNMYMIMNMNIYISPENEKHLRKEESMSGLINRLLGEFYSQGKVTRNARMGTAEERAEGIVSVELPPTIKTPVDVKKSLGSLRDEVKFCKHDMDPQFCKFAPPGKKCK